MKKRIFIGYLFFFYLLWIVYVKAFYPYIQVLDPNSTAFVLINLFARILIWVIPAIIYLRLSNSQTFSIKGLFKPTFRGFLIALLIALTMFLANLVLLGIPSFNFHGIDLNTYVNTIVLVPLIEEFVFRGVILNSILEIVHSETNVIENILTSVLFVGIHVPGWLLYSPNIPIYLPFTLFILSLILGFLSIKYKSILPSSLLHSLNNLFSSIFWI